MPERPRGTVTFLFTDIEGSTRLWQQYPEGMKPALSEHDRLMRDAIESRNGYVFKTIGDAFCAAFATAADAVAAALEAREKLSAARWGEIDTIRARMALHTGTAEEREGDYFGQTLNRVARLLSTGHGGQILISQPTYELVRDSFPESALIEDLGEHRLKDLTRPEHVYQVVTSGPSNEFPALKSQDAKPNNLPIQATRLIGRENEVSAVVQLLRRDDVRLVTLTGPGGTGKTRLSLQVAGEMLAEFENGVFFIGLAPISDPDLVVGAIAQALGLQDVSGRPLIDSLTSFLKNRHLLLLLDNFEQIISAAPLVAGLLKECPTLSVLVTSREVLRLSGEFDYAVPVLTIPKRPQNRGAWNASLPELTQFESVQLFIERAAAIMPEFEVTGENAPAIAEICYRLDGLPLAIELAVARIHVLSPLEILSRLERQLPALGEGARDLPDRQRTLASTIAWSYDLLEASEKFLFRRIAVFVGGFTLDSAEAVCGGRSEESADIDMLDGFTSLTDKSLIKRDRAARGSRFMMLETIHAYAAERLEESGEGEEMRRRHAEYFTTLSASAEVGLTGPEQLQWRDRMIAEFNNLRVALLWLEKDNPETASRALSGLWWFLGIAGLAGEGFERLEILSARPEISDSARVRATYAAALLASIQGEYERALQLGKEALQLARSFDDNKETATALFALSLTQYFKGNFDEVRKMSNEGMNLSAETGDKWIFAHLQRALGLAEGHLGNYGRGTELLEECVTRFREIGDALDVAYTLRNLGLIKLLSGDHGGVADLCRESLSISRKMEDKWSMARALINLASVAASSEGGAERAARLFGVSQALYDDIGARVSPSEKAMYDENVTKAKNAIGNDKTFDALWREGRSMSLDQAIEYALKIGTSEEG